MATSSFSKNFFVPPEKADEFLEEMTREVAPILPKDFKSQLVHLSDDEDLIESILNAR